MIMNGLLWSVGLTDYFPIGLQFIFAIIFVAATIAGSHFLGTRRGGKSKFINFECGIDQKGDSRQPMAVKYFLIAILFVIFDVELVFFYPYAVNFKLLGVRAFWGVVAFIGMFVVGYVYIIKKGVMNWED